MGFKENITKLSHKLNTPFATALIAAVLSALIGSFIGSYLAYRAQASAEMESNALRAVNYLTLIRGDLQRKQIAIDRGQLFDKVILSKFLNWEGMNKELQETVRKEFYGISSGRTFSTRIIGLAMDDRAFLNVDTQLIVTLDEIYATALDINRTIQYMNRVMYDICASNNPKPHIIALRNAEADFNMYVSSMQTILSDCCNIIEEELIRFSHRLPAESRDATK